MCEIIFLVVFHHATICIAIFLYLQNVYILVSEFFSECARPPVMIVCLNHNFGVGSGVRICQAPFYTYTESPGVLEPAYFLSFFQLQ